MRGDRPVNAPVHSSPSGFTPHARGSTLEIDNGNHRQDVYPACAGIDPSFLIRLYFPIGLPRMRGDRPKSLVSHLPFLPFTPHARGSTWDTDPPEAFQDVYPACAGIDPAGGVPL